MKKSFINKEHVEGRVYEHSLALKQVQNTASENYGKDFIGGTLDIATDDDCLNIVTINFTYVTPTTKSGAVNATYSVLKDIIENGKTVLCDGKESATMVTVDTALGVNDFYTNRNGEEVLVSAKRNDGGFVKKVSKLNPDESKRNTFDFDFLIKNTSLIEADEERGIAEDYLVVKGYVFNFRKDILPVDLIVRDNGGINYFMSLEASEKNMTFTKVWGNITSQTIVNTVEEAAAFGGARVKTYDRKIKEWIITGASNEPYEIGDENTITLDELKVAEQNREIALADVKKRQDEYQASKNGNAFNNATSGTTAATGSFIF